MSQSLVELAKSGYLRSLNVTDYDAIVGKPAKAPSPRFDIPKEHIQRWEDKLYGGMLQSTMVRLMAKEYDYAEITCFRAWRRVKDNHEGVL